MKQNKNLVFKKHTVMELTPKTTFVLMGGTNDPTTTTDGPPQSTGKACNTTLTIVGTMRRFPITSLK